MNQISIQFYKTRIGELILGSFDEQLCLLDFRYRKMRDTVDNRIKKGLNAEFFEQESDVIQAAKSQLNEYLVGNRKTFDLPILMVGSDFQKTVWEALMEVPYGATSTYLQLSQAINKEKAIRAVASANGANSLALIIPCHRIIGSDDKLVGYGGGLNTKQRLLNLEQQHCDVSTLESSARKAEQPQTSFSFSFD